MGTSGGPPKLRQYLVGALSRLLFIQIIEIT